MKASFFNKYFDHVRNYEVNVAFILSMDLHRMRLQMLDTIDEVIVQIMRSCCILVQREGIVLGVAFVLLKLYCDRRTS